MNQYQYEIGKVDTISGARLGTTRPLNEALSGYTDPSMPIPSERICWEEIASTPSMWIPLMLAKLGLVDLVNARDGNSRTRARVVLRTRGPGDMECRTVRFGDGELSLNPDGSALPYGTWYPIHVRKSFATWCANANAVELVRKRALGESQVGSAVIGAATHEAYTNVVERLRQEYAKSTAATTTGDTSVAEAAQIALGNFRHYKTSFTTTGLDNSNEDSSTGE